MMQQSIVPFRSDTEIICSLDHLCNWEWMCVRQRQVPLNAFLYDTQRLLSDRLGLVVLFTIDVILVGVIQTFGCGGHGRRETLDDHLHTQMCQVV